MEQSIATGKNRNEGTELGRVNNLALVHSANFSGRGVENHLDATLGFSNGTAVLGANGHRSNDTVVVNRDIRTGLLLQGVDDLALWPNDLTDLVDWNLDVDDLRSNGSYFSARLGHRGAHDVQNLETGHLGLMQRLGQNFGGQAVDLGVELQRSYGVGRTGHLEVHVTERVFGTEDVGQRDVLAAVVYQTHRNTGYGSLDWYTGRHERQR